MQSHKELWFTIFMGQTQYDKLLLGAIVMFFEPDVVGIRSLQPDKDFHHWDPTSEVFASTSHLLSAILRGWVVNTAVIRRAYHFGGGRHTYLYYFELKRRGEYMTMPVVDNPSVMRLIALNPFEVVEYRQQHRFATYDYGSTSARGGATAV